MIALKIIPLLIYNWFFARFYIRLLNPRYSGHLIVALFIAYDVILGHYIISRHFEGFPLSSLFTHIGFVLLIILFFRGDVVKKIALGAIGYAIYNLSSYLVLIPLSLAENRPEWLLTLIERSRLAVAILLLEIISRKCTQFGGALSRKFSATILLPVLFVLLANELIYFAHQRVRITPLIAMLEGREALPGHYFLDELTVLLTAALGLAVLLIVVFVNNAMLESRLQEQQLNLQIEHYKLLDQKSRLFAALRHDMKNHILSLQGLLVRGELAQTARYLERMSESGTMAEPVITTGNSALDAVLNEKYQQSMAYDIDFSCEIAIPKLAQLDSFDLCIILGNAVDNAIEACIKCGSKRFIHLKSGTVKSFLVLEIRNSTVLQELSVETKKFDSTFHGIGLENIHAIVERHGGTVDITLDKGEFVLSVLLPV